jgi:hypothetical protein
LPLSYYYLNNILRINGFWKCVLIRYDDDGVEKQMKLHLVIGGRGFWTGIGFGREKKEQQGRGYWTTLSRSNIYIHVIINHHNSSHPFSQLSSTHPMYIATFSSSFTYSKKPKRWNFPNSVGD